MVSPFGNRKFGKAAWSGEPSRADRSLQTRRIKRTSKSRTIAPTVAFRLSAHEPGSKMNAKPRRQPIPDIGADHADDDIANDPHSIFRHELRGDPSDEEAGQQNDDKALIGQMQGG